MTDNVKPEPADLEKMDGASLDIAEQRRRELKQLLPGVFTETTGPDGQPVETIDFERLKAELGTFSDVYEGRRERYGMEWPGKRDCMKLIQEPSRATLKPCREESVDFDTTQNLFIEGDNLEVLKLLQKSYYGKVKMIYIDPPYNTGNEFIYPDKYAESLETYLAYAGLVDDEGKKFSTNTAAEGRFHTKWLNMMYPRLYLARNLLSEDGVIFISIDDNEEENLRRICDEVFGEENFIANAIWQKKQSPQNDATNLSDMHDHVLIYAKVARKQKNETVGWVRNLLPRDDAQESRYSNPDSDERGDWTSSDLTCNKTSEERPNLYFPIINPNTGEEVWPSKTRVWGYEKPYMEMLLNDGRIWWGESGTNKPRLKRFRTEVEDGVVPSTWWSREKAGDNQEARRELRSIFPEGDFFDTPKPTRLLELMLKISVGDGDVVLDFFAGSGTTAHAVMEINGRDSKDLKFIMVQLPEKVEEDSIIAKSGFANIADVCKERIRRSAEGVKSKYSVTGGDFGFKVLKLGESSFKQWQLSSEELTQDQLGQQLELHTDHIDSRVSQEDLLYELLIKAGFEPTEKVEKLELAGMKIFSIAEGALLICLEDQLTSELIDAVADLEPMQFICLDKGFKGNDQLKANAVQTFKSRSQGAETEMVFKVV